MKTRIAAITTVLILGVAPISSAMAFDTTSRYTSHSPYDVDTTGSIERALRGPSWGPSYGGCQASSAAEGNANQQTRPVMQYGQTSGGTRC